MNGPYGLLLLLHGVEVLHVEIEEVVRGEGRGVVAVVPRPDLVPQRVPRPGQGEIILSVSEG